MSGDPNNVRASIDGSARLRQVLGMRLSSEASDYLKKLAIVFARNEFSMMLKFDEGKEGGVHAELQAAGYIRPWGARGSSWRFTEGFKEWAMENRPDLDE